MIIKSFVARNANEALRRVRKEMGGDAIVLKTRQLVDDVDGARVEVTACLERPSVGQTSDILARNGGSPATALATSAAAETVDISEETIPRVQVAEKAVIKSDLNIQRLEQKIDRLLARPHWNVSIDTASLVACLADTDTPNEVIDEFLQGFDDRDPQSGVKTLAALIEPMIERELSFASDDRIVVVGLAGAGKSSLIGKLAARFVAREKKAVTLSTLDEQRIAAYDELQSYAAILGTEIKSPKEAKGVRKGISLIDTPAISRERKTFAELKSTIADLRPKHCFAVVPATHRSADIRGYINSLKDLGATHLIATMVDQTDRWGSILTACRASGLKLAMVVSGPGGTGSLEKPNAQTIAEMLLTKETSGDRA